MIDTLHIWLPLNESRPKWHAAPYLVKLSESIKDNGDSYITGKLSDILIVNENIHGLSLKGSMPNYFLPGNTHTLNRSSLKMAFEKISDELHFDISIGIINRLDLAMNILTNQEVKSYFPLFNDSKYYKRFEQPNSIYWSNGNRTKLIYDKVAESRHKRKAIPKVWENSNVLRFELRFMRRLANQLKLNSLTIGDLLNTEVYMILLDQLKLEYFSINKNYQEMTDISSILKPNDFISSLAARQINDVGINNILAEIEQMKSLGVFQKAEYYSRTKNKIKEIAKNYPISDTATLITEIDKKVKSQLKHYR